MKVPKKISYSEDVDILMIQLSNKKIDDSYDVDDMIVQVDEKGEPVLLEIFNGKKHLMELGKTVSRKIQKEIWPSTSSVSIAHEVKVTRK
ncbi:MAG: DUF2283 domain-containing protein [Candidatus Daviesbacteria bacterium]|nr:DUF2283 domain-containing protein [Candidatus Daviesbacteria bacterium]